MEEQTGTDDLGIVAHEHCALRKEAREVTEGKFLNVPSLVTEQFGAAAVGQGIFGDTLVGQGVVVVGYLDVLGSDAHWSACGK